MRKLINSIGTTIEKVGDAFDKNITSKEEVLDILKDLKSTAIEAEKEVLLAEMRGTRAQRNWRPYLMYSFGFIIFYSLLIAPLFDHFWGVPQPVVPSDIWDILSISISGYIIGRSAEKTLPALGDAAKGFLKNKRNEQPTN